MIAKTKTNDEKKSEKKERNRKRERDETSDHLQSATIAGESIFVMNCGPVTPTVEPILLLQVYKFLPWPQTLKPKTRSPLVHD